MTQRNESRQPSRWENPSVHMGARRFHHLLHSELDAIQKDPSRPADDRLDAWEEEQSREPMCTCTFDAGGIWLCDYCEDREREALGG